jgi:hypothetical protein
VSNSIDLSALDSSRLSKKELMVGECVVLPGILADL